MNLDDKTLTLLLVEDNDGDVRLIKEAFKESKVLKDFSVVTDGEQALDYLHKRGSYQSSIKPDLIILDLNLPKLSGFDVLADIKSAPQLKKIPVIIFSSSTSDSDILRSYDLKANSYVSKPSDFDAFLEAVRNIEEFWLRTVRLPLN